MNTNLKLTTNEMKVVVMPKGSDEIFSFSNDDEAKKFVNENLAKYKSMSILSDGGSYEEFNILVDTEKNK